ncbi:MAG: hypothetical protein LBR88_02790 [Zoogloeaceae bacterium]|jgi:hypothetical protein|nr:hypothetical protein [Zoogloeaceae bacterium]
MMNLYHESFQKHMHDSIWINTHGCVFFHMFGSEIVRLAHDNGRAREIVPGKIRDHEQVLKTPRIYQKNPGTILP